MVLLNAFACLVAPLTLMLLILRGESRRLNLFLILGMLMCVLVSYFNGYFGVLFRMSDDLPALTVYISPICEEIFKALPIIIYAMLFTDRPQNIISASIAVGIGFATLENCYYLINFSQELTLTFALMRGFAAGIMHGICTATVGYGLTFIRTRRKLFYTGTFGLLFTAMTYHALYNMLAGSGDRLAEAIGLALPVCTVLTVCAAYALFRRAISIRAKKDIPQ